MMLGQIRRGREVKRRMEEHSAQEAIETFRLYSDDGMSGVTCVLRPDGRYEVVKCADGTSGKAATTGVARERCHEVASDYFRYQHVIHRIERVEEEMKRLRQILT